MYINRFFSLPSILVLSWKQIIGFAAYSILAVVLYEYLEYTWMFIPWQPVTLIGTVLAFYLGFKNNSAYSRSWESRKIWGAIVNASRSWGILVKDFINNQEEESRKLLAYCGLSWEDAVMDFHKNKRAVLTASASQVRQPLYKGAMEKWCRYEKFLGPLQQALEEK